MQVSENKMPGLFIFSPGKNNIIVKILVSFNLEPLVTLSKPCWYGIVVVVVVLYLYWVYIF